MNHTYQTLCICAVREVLSDPKLEVRRVCYWHRMSGLLATFARFPCGFCLPKHHSQKPSFSCGYTLVHWHADWKVQRRWGFVHFCGNTLWCLFWFVEWMHIGTILQRCFELTWGSFGWGIIALDIRLLCISVYTLRARKSAPQALHLAAKCAKHAEICRVKDES